MKSTQRFLTSFLLLSGISQTVLAHGVGNGGDGTVIGIRAEANWGLRIEFLVATV